jgi:hypothetical protein
MDERIATLKAEFEKGQEELNRLELRRQEIYTTMLRISGAIQVLEEVQQASMQQPDKQQVGLRSTAA